VSSRVQEEENDTMRMREIDVHDYARQLLEAHGDGAVARSLKELAPANSEAKPKMQKAGDALKPR